MTVAELQLLLSDLSKFLRASESAKVAGELEYISTKLALFRDYKLKMFADFLEKAEAYLRGALAPPKPKGGGAKRVKADPTAVEQGCQQVLDLYARAIDPRVTVEQIESAVQALQDLALTKDRLDELARQMGYSQKFKKKEDVIKAIRQKIIGRKGAFERPNA
jgi:hypothetical protein